MARIVSASATGAISKLMPGPGQIVVGGPTGPVKHAYVRTPGSRTAAIGDSITQGSSLTKSFADNSWFTWAALLSGGRIRPVVNAGISGNTTTQMLARLQTDVIAYAPARCVILGGTNDIGGSGIALATTRDNIQAMITQLRANGIEPILATIPPSDTNFATVAGVNAVVARLAEANGCHLLDFHALLVDPTNGHYLSGYSGDGAHPVAAQCKAMGQYAATQLTAVYPFQPTIFVEDAAADSTNLLTNALFIGDTNSDGIADSWLGNGLPAAGYTPSLVSGDASIAGNWQQLTSTGSTTTYFSQSPSTGWAAGDRLVLTGKLSITAVTTGYSVSVVVHFSGVGDSSHDLTAVSSIGQTVTNGTFYGEITVPTGATFITVQLITKGGTGGTAQFAQVALRNLTALGLA